MTPSVLPLEFFHRSAPEVARDLLGAVLVSHTGGSRVTGRIVETEAYLGHDDPASHAWQGRRHRQNEGIYSPPGSWYVYLSYGVHWCANLVCGPEGLGAAVLLRGIMPLEGLEVMRRRRGGGRRAHAVTDRTLVDGPGKLCQALGITRALDRVPMVDSAVVILEGDHVSEGLVQITPRIGITKAADLPLRFVAPRLTQRPSLTPASGGIAPAR
jgi:DNA-3-methyladenine glycosylase